MTSEQQAAPAAWPRGGGSATPLPPPSGELRRPDGRLAHWVFGLPVAELRAGYRSAVYFDRARRILAGEGADTRVTMQVFQRADGVVACGVDEALAVLALGAGAFTDQDAADRAFGEHLQARNQARRARVLGGPAYLEAVRAQVDTEIALDQLWRSGGGELLARRSLVASNVRKVVGAAKGKPVLFFADRFDHWATQGGDGYAAFVGGAQGVATDAQAAWWGERGLGTIPHALIAVFNGDTVAATGAFERQMPNVPLIALVDFDNDSVATSLACARAFGDRLWGVRLDTSSMMVDRALWSEMGDFVPTGVNPRLVWKVRQALDAEGFAHIRVIVSGGFTAGRIAAFEAGG